MSLQIPTLAELNATIIAQFEAQFGQNIPLFLKDPLRVISKVWAGVLIALYKFGGSVFLQQFVQYASTEETSVNGRTVIPLVEWGRLVGVGDRTAATRAEYAINITVTSIGGTLPAGTQLFNSTNGFTYITLLDTPLAFATVATSIRAVRDQVGGGGAGTKGNMSVDDIVTFVNPLPNVAADAVVTSEIVTGADAESWDAYRQRVIDRFRSQPQGGAYVDYQIWGEEVEGIINIYPYTGDPGEVNVYAEATPASSGNPDGIPTQAQLDAVSASIEQDDTGLASRRPVNSFVNVYGITRTVFDVEVQGITGVEDADLPDLQTKITESLTNYFLSREPYISGLSLGRRRDRISDAEVSGVVADTCVAFDATYTELTVEVALGSPFYIYSLGEGEKARLGAATYPAAEIEIYVYASRSLGFSGSEISAIQSAAAAYINGLAQGTDVTILGVTAAVEADPTVSPKTVDQIWLGLSGPPTPGSPLGTSDITIGPGQKAVVSVPGAQVSATPLP